uniref:Cytochrome P450 n=1 Tax=Oryza punctata TaxID=4537 RepID=A0A0E0L1S9_ORYPU
MQHHIYLTSASLSPLRAMLIMLGLGPAGAAALAIALSGRGRAAAYWWTAERAPRRLKRALRAQAVPAPRRRRGRERTGRPGRGRRHSAALALERLPRVMIPDPELVREVFQKFDQFGKPKMIRVGKLIATGVVSYEGEKWAKDRRILNPAFHHEKIKRMLPVFANCCTEMITRWENSVPLEAASEIDVWPKFQNLTGDVISRTVFGGSYQEGSRIFTAARRAIGLYTSLSETFYTRLLVLAN